MALDDVCYLTATEAARQVRAREISPVALVAAVLDRIARYDDVLRAFVTVTADAASAHAHAAERAIATGAELGPLHGVPIAIKDIVDVAGVPTLAGSRVLAGNVAARDAALVTALRAAGAIIIGKTTTHEFAYGVITAPTRNPWDVAYLPGGSSGGSAAAVAAGMAFGAVGTDTAGSIRLPAALCGAVGLKPTYGRVSCNGVIPLSWSLDHAGPIARDVADAALLLDVMTAGTERATRTRDALDEGIGGPRAGVARPYFFDGLEPAVARAMEGALDVLKILGVTLAEVALPDADLTFPVGRAVQRPEASVYHSRWLRRAPHLYTEEVRRNLEIGELFGAVDYVHAQRVRADLRRRWLAAMDAARVDVLLSPTVIVAAPPATPENTNAALGGTLLHNTYPFNLCGFPALSVPCGFSPDGLPIGLQIIGRPDDEAAVLRLGHAYEEATPWHNVRPPVGHSSQ